MLEITFKNFMESDYPGSDMNGPWCVYVLKARNKVLYVGKSETGVWDRWFGGLNSHLVKAYDGHWFATTTAGHAVMEHMPESLGWKIELWTREDCVELAGNKYDGWDKYGLPVGYLETDMIKLRKPSLNVQR
jgi:hypothetical protein